MDGYDRLMINILRKYVKMLIWKVNSTVMIKNEFSS